MQVTCLYKEFKIDKSNKKKTQIILCHTSREAEEYLVSLKFRYNNKYDKIPHYLIKKDGDVLSLLHDNKTPNFFSDEKMNNNSIIVSLTSILEIPNEAQ